MDEYRKVMAILDAGRVEELTALSGELDAFPSGVDPYLGRRWIINAIGSASGEAVLWMLREGVELNFRDDEGYTPLHAVLERKHADRYRLLEELLIAGAPVNRKGVNDWTPAHMAAAHDDVAALQILVRHGADLSIRTCLDDHATPLEEARNLGRLNAIAFLEGVSVSDR